MYRKTKENEREKTFWHLPSLLAHDSWSKVCKTCNKHRFRSYVKKMCKALSWNQGEIGQSVNTNGGQNAIAVCIFHASVKTKEVKRDWFLPRLVEDIERKTFCVYIVQMLIICFVFHWLRSKKNRPENAWKCICESLELQNSPGEHAPGPP